MRFIAILAVIVMVVVVAWYLLVEKNAIQIYGPHS